jgi:hypothetical protein
MLKWEQSVIEDALGEDAAVVLPEAIRLVELRAAGAAVSAGDAAGAGAVGGTSVDHLLTRELEDLTSAHAEELVAAVPELNVAL